MASGRHWALSGAKLEYHVQKAVQRDQLEAVFQFRYEVYCQDGRGNREGLDHRSKVFVEILDDEHAQQLVVEDQDRLVGALRLNLLAHSPFPDDLCDWLGMEGLLSEWRPDDLAYGSRLMVAPSHRKTKVGMLLICAGYQAMRECGVRLVLMYCRPELANLYERFGFLPYRNAFEHPVSGTNVPLVWPLCDINHLRAVDSPVLRTGADLSHDKATEAWVERIRKSLKQAVLATEAR